jgi:hypothetical protein
VLLAEQGEVDLVGDLVAQGDRHGHRLAVIGDQRVDAGEAGQIGEGVGVQVADEFEGGVALARLAGVGFGHERHDRGGGGVDALHDQLAAGAGLGLLALLPDLLVAGNAQAGAFLLQFELGGVQVVLLPSRHRLPSGDAKVKTGGPHRGLPGTVLSGSVVGPGWTYVEL